MAELLVLEFSVTKSMIFLTLSPLCAIFLFSFYILFCVLVTQSCPTLCYPIVCPWSSLGRDTEVGCHSLLQGIFPTRGSNLGLLHCRQMLYCLSHQGIPLQADSLPSGLAGKACMLLGSIFYS